MAILLVYDRDNVHEDPVEDYAGCYKKGYIVEAFEDSKPYVNPPSPPFLILQITDRTKAQVDQYSDQWIRAVDYTIVARDVVQDGWRLEIRATNPNVSNKGQLTQAMVENFITEWGGSVVSFINYGVRFDISVYLAATSRAFWDRNVTPISFSETSYDQETGVHRITANYGGVSVPPGTSLGEFENAFALAVVGKGGTVVSNSAPVIVFDIQRDTVIGRFREEVKQALQKTVCRRRLYLDPAYVDTILANRRVMIDTAAGVLPYIKDRLAE